MLEVWLFSQLWSLCPVQMTGKKKKELVLSYVLHDLSIYINFCGLSEKVCFPSPAPLEDG